MKRFSVYISLCCFFIGFQAAVAQDIQPVEQSLYKNLEFKMPEVDAPSFPKFSVKITDFDAMGNGVFNNSEAFKKAIARVNSEGGGTVNVPRGIWLTGPIVLKSNVNLHLDEGALVLFSSNLDDYPLIKTSFEGLNTQRCQSPISAENAENIAITGKRDYRWKRRCLAPGEKRKNGSFKLGKTCKIRRRSF